jgi:hypothetical protein
MKQELRWEAGETDGWRDGHADACRCFLQIFRTQLKDLRRGGFYHCHYSLSAYHSNELQRVNMLHERNFCNERRKSFFKCVMSIMCALIMSLCGCVKCIMSYKALCYKTEGHGIDSR